MHGVLLFVPKTQGAKPLWHTKWITRTPMRARATGTQGGNAAISSWCQSSVWRRDKEYYMSHGLIWGCFSYPV